MMVGTMFASASTTITPLQVVILRKNKKAVFIDIIILFITGFHRANVK